MIEIKHLTKTFHSAGGEVEALKDISLTIKDGDIFGIIGMSGAGKSTLVRCINMLERPTAGQVLIDGRDLGAMSEKELRAERRNITMIFQHFNLLQQRTCLKNVCFPMEISGMKPGDAKRRAMELLELVGLPDKANAYPSQLSGGQQQRVGIARALVAAPPVHFLVEGPTPMVPHTTPANLVLIRDINRKLGITVVIITHQMSVVEEICTHVAILDGGEVAEQGTVGTVFSSPKSAAAKRLVFPNGEDELVSDPTVEQRVRVVFNGADATGKPLIATMAQEKGILVSILAASTRGLDGKAYGSMLLAVPGGKEQVGQVIEYLQSVPGVLAEEV